MYTFHVRNFGSGWVLLRTRDALSTWEFWCEQWGATEHTGRKVTRAFYSPCKVSLDSNTPGAVRVVVWANRKNAKDAERRARGQAKLAASRAPKLMPGRGPGRGTEADLHPDTWGK